MPRRPLAPIDTTRRLAHVHLDGSGATGTSWKGEIYVRGMEAELPADFPDDGPMWEDWIPEPETKTKHGLAAHLAREEAKALAEQRLADGAGDEDDEREALGLDPDAHEDDLSHLPPGLIATDEDAVVIPPVQALQQPMPAGPGARRARGPGSGAARARG